MTTSEKYRRIAELNGMAPSKAAEVAGILYATLNAAIRDDREMNISNHRKYLQFYKVSFDQWDNDLQDYSPVNITSDNNLKFEKNYRSVKLIPLYDTQAMAGQYKANTTNMDYPEGMIDIGDLLRDSEVAIRVGGNSMMPGYPPGSIVGLKRMKDKTTIKPGHVYAYVTKDDRDIKRLFVDKEKPGFFLCISDTNTKFETGPMAGQYFYPPYHVNVDEILMLFAVVGVSKRNLSEIIIP